MEQQGMDFAAIPQTAIRFITSPAAFYKEMPKKGGFVEPLVFAVAMGVLGGIIQALASLVGFNPAAGAVTGLASLIVIPIGVAIFGFVGAAIIFVIWKLMGSQEDYETAYRCGAYAAAFTPITMVIGFIPYAGGAVGILIMTYLLVVASVEVHKLPVNKAWLVFGIIAALLIVSSISGQMAANKFNAQMQESAARMQESANAMQNGAARQLDASIAQMEAQLQSLPPDQQKQMRQTIEQMKKSRSEMDD